MIDLEKLKKLAEELPEVWELMMFIPQEVDQLAEILQENSYDDLDGCKQLVQYFSATTQSVIIELIAQLEQYKKDAERLNWIEQDMKNEDDGVAIEFDDGAFGFSYIVHGSPMGGGVGYSRFGNLREAIDAAMKKEST